MKKVNKNTLALRSNSPALPHVFGGQTILGPWPYECNAQMICIGHLDNKSKNFKIMQNNK